MTKCLAKKVSWFMIVLQKGSVVKDHPDFGSTLGVLEDKVTKLD